MIKLFGIVFLIFSVAFGAQGQEEDMEREVAAEVVKKHVFESFPDFSSKGWILDSIERDEVWVFFYRAPSDARGGGPVVIIKKGTYEVLDSYREQ
ncbi:hypothetical protein D9M68_621930 [compost metagenome]